MEKITEVLEQFLKGAQRTVFLAIGSILRSDDAAGIIAAEALLEYDLPESFKVLLGHTAPENLTGEIKKFAPTHLIICDAAESGIKTGEISIIASDLVDGAAFSTHMMPMNVFINYISVDNPCKSLILGIQPANLEFGEDVTPEVKAAAEKLAQIIIKIIN